jgi:hypothetical protein
VIYLGDVGESWTQLAVEYVTSERRRDRTKRENTASFRKVWRRVRIPLPVSVISHVICEVRFNLKGDEHP